MPNHCSNKLVIKGNVAKFKKGCIKANTDKDAWDKLIFDFNTIVPCPESMYKVTHSLEELKKMDEKQKDAKYPAMIQWKDAKYPAMIQLAEENMDKYGFSYWYDFCSEKWGTKWNSYDLEIDIDKSNELVLLFYTAWTPANDNFVRVMSEKFPDLSFIWYYYEPSEKFAGYFEACNGDVTDNYYSNDEKEYSDIARDEFNEDKFEEENA
jgi:hypothetical protein